MPPERHFNHEIVLEDKDGNIIHLGKADSLFEGIEKTINKELEKEAVEEQKTLKKAQRKEKLEKINKVVKLVETIVLFYSLYYKHKKKGK